MVIDPSKFNPSLNRVECVVEASSRHNFRNVEKAFPQICWLILCSSLIGSNLISMLFLQYCKERYQGDHEQSAKVKSALLFVFVLFWLGVVEAIVAAVYSTQLQVLYPLIYLFFIFLVCLRRFLYCLNGGHIHRHNCTISWKFEKGDEAEPAWGFLCTAYPGCFIAVHHTLWVMIGIITEPFWALPILTTIVMLAFLFYVLSSFFFSYAKWDKWQAINFALLVVVGMSIMLVQFSFFLIGQQFFDESLISGAIQSALVVIISI